MRTLPLRTLILALTVAACSGPEPRRAIESKSVRPGINQRFLSDDLTIDGAKKMFEVESREIFAHRQRVVAALDLKAGQAVADIGAGTGLFTVPFARRVGAGGKVFAVDLAPKFVGHLEELARQRNLPQIEAVECTERDAKLPEATVDVAFICDTYHHFEYPQSTMASIRQALKPGGTLVIVDFERIEGVSRQWTLDHVRCGKSKVIEEVEAAGFEFTGEQKIQGLRENYCIRFRRS